MKLIAPEKDRRFKHLTLSKNDEGLYMDKEAVFVTGYVERGFNVYYDVWIPGSHLDPCTKDFDIIGPMPMDMVLCNIYEVNEGLAASMVESGEGIILEFYDIQMVFPTCYPANTKEFNTLKCEESYGNIIYRQ